MPIIMDLGESEKVVESFNGSDWTNLYLYCMKNVERVDETVNYKLLEIGMFGSYESIYDYSGNNDYLSSCSFP